MIEEFDGSFLIRAFLIERECVYSQKERSNFRLGNYKFAIKMKRNSTNGTLEYPTKNILSEIYSGV